MPPRIHRGGSMDAACDALRKFAAGCNAPYVMEDLARLPVPSVPHGVLKAVWWFASLRLVSAWDQSAYHHVRRLAESLYGLTEDQSRQLMHVQIKLSWLRTKVHHMTLPKHFSLYEIWIDAYRAGCVTAALRWKKRGRIPSKGTGWDSERAASRLHLPEATLSRWMDEAEDGRIDLTPPEMLDSRARRSRHEARRAELLVQIAAQAELQGRSIATRTTGTLALPAPAQLLEVRAKGVVTTSGDVRLITRKRELAAEMSGQVSVRITGGQLVVQSDFIPHPGQRAFLECGARFRFAVAGIRGGKTRAGADEAVRHAIMMPGSHGWVVGPTYGMLDVARRAILEDTTLAKRPDLAPSGYLKKDHCIRFANGSLLEFRSAEWEDTLRGPGIDWMWIDEIEMIKESAWKICMGRTSDTLGRIWGTGTPMGRNWLYRWFSKGEDAGEPDVASFRFPSWMNPMVLPEEIERARRDNPDAYFRQEYMAEFVDGVATVFGNLSPVLVDEIPQRDDWGGVVLGVDFARKQDFTFLVPMSSAGHVLPCHRLRHTSWKLQLELVLEEVAKYGGCPVVADAAGPGDPVVEQLQAAGVHVVPMGMSSPQVKRNLIEQLMLDVEGGRIWLPRDEERLLLELQIYRRGISPSGQVTYSAPDGEHDDGVIALACANWGVNKLRMSSGYVDIADVGEGPSGPEETRRDLFRGGTSVLFGGPSDRDQDDDRGSIWSGRRRLFGG